jgi:hypothetical protein
MFGQTGAVAIDKTWLVVGASGSERVFIWKRHLVDEQGGWWCLGGGGVWWWCLVTDGE